MATVTIMTTMEKKNYESYDNWANEEDPAAGMQLAICKKPASYLIAQLN